MWLLDYPTTWEPDQSANRVYIDAVFLRAFGLSYDWRLVIMLFGVGCVLSYELEKVL
jgi:hypothetical protein